MLHAKESGMASERRRSIWLMKAAALIIMMLLTACGATTVGDEQGAAHHSKQDHLLPNGDLRQWTSSVNESPSFLKDGEEELRLVYKLAAENAQLLQWMPCYCGCGDSSNHRSNLDCFVHERLEDGSIQWDDHGTRCGVCLQIAVEAVKLEQEGNSLDAVRKIIDDKYREGYAAPTPTPMPTI
ncbi:PCYCGC domain-containing protein [Paenibacillus sp. ACRRX]|uniref:PCYCGC domain-containing protein n=1 Tax=Paenibacillus sp. ACRRX TaxID=2918206 RepID=UPI001EF3F414|nr:PCYCGC domain-containing protein [Paenibacillus sp. ACRRX]MCG7410325.1 PCYCGC domain-containing protein [Paenibacillus sp. ACRRX]